MKSKCIAALFLLVFICSVVLFQLSALGQPTSNESNEDISNQPMDHRYRMIMDRREETSMFSIAEKSAIEKRGLLDLLVKAAIKYDLEPALVVAIATQESMLNPNAQSHMGAMGLMQLMPATARNFGVKNIFDPKQNAEGGARYFRFLLNELDGNEELSLAAYNAGIAPVQQYKAVPPFEQTKTFVKRVLKLRDHYRQVLE